MLVSFDPALTELLLIMNGDFSSFQVPRFTRVKHC